MWSPKTAICTCLLGITWIVETAFPQESVCPGHVWCLRLWQNLLYKVCSHVEPAFSGFWGSRFSQEPGEVWNFTWELLRAWGREGNQAGIWGRGKDWEPNEQRGWAWKIVWVRKWDQGVRLGLGFWRQTMSRLLYDLPLLATSMAFDLHSFAGSISVYSQRHS